MKINEFTKLTIAFLLGMFIFVGIGTITGIFKKDNQNDLILSEIKKCWNEKGDVYVFTSSQKIKCKTELEKEIYP